MNTEGQLILPDFKTQDKIVTKTMWYWHEDKEIHETEKKVLK